MKCRALVFLAAGFALPTFGQAPSREASAITSLAIFAGTGAGLYRSSDWGTSFERVVGRGEAVLEKAGSVRCLLPLGPQVLVGADAGVYYSPDFGEAWKRVSDAGPCSTLLASRYPLADRTLFLGTPKGLLRSTPDLFTPEEQPRQFLPTPISEGQVTGIEWPGPELFVATSLGLFVSTDSGRSFARVGAGERAALPAGELTALTVSAYFSADPAMVVSVATEGVYRSADGGRSWLHAGLRGRRVHQLVWLGPFLYAATDAGLHRTEDLGREWVRLDEGLGGRQARRLLFPLAPASGAEAFLATERGIFWTGDGGLHWSPLGGALAEQEILAIATFPSPDAVRKRRRR